MLVPVDEIADIGIVKDVKDYLLPPNAWTHGQNVRFRDGKVTTSPGSLTTFGTPSVAPYWLLPVFDVAGEVHWLYAGLEKVYDYSSGTHTDITNTGGDYSATADGLWTGGLLGSIPIINNGVDKPQMWAPISSAQELVDLTNWPSNHVCDVIRVFKNFLFALAPTEAGTKYPHRVRVSDPADPGSVPVSWDETDETKAVYVQDLSDTDAGPLIDAARLGNQMLLYKERATWSMHYIGGQSIWQLDPALELSGILAKNCVCSFNRGRQHFVATGDDVVFHDGQEPTSVLEKKARRWLLANMDSNTYRRSFCVPHSQEKENWFCFPLDGSLWPNIALIHNWQDNTVTFRDIDQASFIAAGRIPTTVGSWDSDTGSWDSDLAPWDEFADRAFTRSLLQAKPDATKLLQLDASYYMDGASYPSTLERTGLDVIGVDRYGHLQRDRNTRRLITGVWPKMSGTPVYITLGRYETLEGSIEWGERRLFTPGIDERVDFYTETGVFGIRFESAVNGGSWSLEGYELDIVNLGRKGF